MRCSFVREMHLLPGAAFLFLLLGIESQPGTVLLWNSSSPVAASVGPTVHFELRRHRQVSTGGSAKVCRTCRELTRTPARLHCPARGRFVIFIVVSRVGAQRLLIVVLIGISLMTNEIQRFSRLIGHLCVCAFHFYKWVLFQIPFLC